MKRTLLFSLGGALGGILLGIVISRLSNETISWPWTIGVGLTGGLIFGALLSRIPFSYLLYELSDPFVEFLSGCLLEGCCSLIFVCLLGISTFLVTLVVCQQIWLSVLVGTGTMGLLFLGIALMAFIEKRNRHHSLPRIRQGSPLSGEAIS